MIVKLNLQYFTQAGEDLRVNVLNAEGRAVQYEMQSNDGNEWTAKLDVELTASGHIDYYYSVYRQMTEIRREWQMLTHRICAVDKTCKTYVANDLWYDIPSDSYLYSSAFTECVHRRSHENPSAEDSKKSLFLKVRAPQLRAGDRLVLVGDDELFGAWDVTKGLAMYEHDDNEWMVTIDADAVKRPISEYKFVILSEKEGATPIWEEGFNRQLVIPMPKKDEVIAFELPQATFAIYNERYAGTAIPVFSLRSEGSFGVGDFGDLRLMVDWVSKTRQRVLQILPINDTTSTHTWTDSYPYSCISIFALHPQYCDLRQLPTLADKKKEKEFEALRKELNALTQIDYERVNNAKNEYLHLIFEQEGKKALASKEFKAFFEEEQHWLVPYAQFCVLRDKFGTAHYTEWADHNVWNEADRKALSSSRTKAYAEASYFYYVQFVLSQQMKGAHEYARQNKVVLKGDIPIGVSRFGCDAWMEPRYFNLNGQAGAPPDDFSVNGQNWGFPTYNWDEMLKDDCAWWVRRFSNMAKYFDAYRIDHVLGFFRIWEIPTHSVHGLLGQFQPSLGMTRSEVEQYGLQWQEEFFLEPFITDWVLDRHFGDKAQYVKDTFVEPWREGCYRMREGFRTQREVEAYFCGKTSKEDMDMRDTLYSLISNVLFLRDHKNPDLVHPRIASQLATCYETLMGGDKFNYNRLYNDYFYRRNNHFWYKEAMKKLPRLINATRMLVCAEDLGMVPDCVPWVMDELRILSLEIQSMPKDSSVRFGKLHCNPYRSVCTISSHDTATLRMWWDEDEERTQDYYNSRLRRGGAAPHPMPDWLARDVVSRHLLCPSMLCILTLQDWLATDETLRLADANAERINIPANPKHYWRYRMHLTLEQLLKADTFNNNLKELIKETGRK